MLFLLRENNIAFVILFIIDILTLSNLFSNYFLPPFSPSLPSLVSMLSIPITCSMVRHWLITYLLVVNVRGFSLDHCEYKSSSIIVITVIASKISHNCKIFRNAVLPGKALDRGAGVSAVDCHKVLLAGGQRLVDNLVPGTKLTFFKYVYVSLCYIHYSA